MRSSYLLHLFILYSAVASAQQISGIVQNAEGSSINAATVSLLVAKDSSVYKLTVTKGDGRFHFNAPKPGRYVVSSTHVGYGKSFSKTLVVSADYMAEDVIITLKKTSTNLTDVTVVTRKPVIEVKADRMILNVEGTINSVGSDAMELLRKSPGVNVDNDDNLSLSGKNGVQVFIDGKVTPLSGQDLSTYLKSIQSAQIEAIEIITNPSARYEAAGNAGIINIRLKKNKSFGTNGSVNLGYGIGAYAKYNGGAALNYRNKRMNVFANYTYGSGRSLITTYTYREVLDSIFDQVARRVITDKPHNLKLGADYFISKTSTIGVMINTMPGSQVYDTKSSTIIKSAKATNIDRLLSASNVGVNKRKNTNANVNYRYAKADKEINIDGDYAYYNITSDQLQPNYYYNSSNALLYSRIYNMLAPGTINLYSLKLSYDQDYNKGKLSVGGKYSYVNSNNDFLRFDVINNVNRKDSLRSNSFLYKENINAMYANYSKEYKHVLIQYGLRVENTIVTGYTNGYALKSILVPYDSLFKRNYTNLFPSASITFKKDKNNQLGVSYSRRIDRPAYQDLNPFEFKVDEYTYRKGNTNLKPQYTNSFGVTHVYKNKLTTSLNYSHVKDMFAQIFDTADLTRTFITRSNLATQDIISLNFNYSIQHKRYSLFANLNNFYSSYKANFGVGRTINLNVLSANINVQQSMKFGKGYTAELTTFYSSPSVVFGTFKGSSIASIDVGLQKNFFDNKINVKASVADVFFTQQGRGVSEFAGQYLKVKRTWEPRLFRINATYRFGSNQVKAARQRKTGLEEESKRIQTGS